MTLNGQSFTSNNELLGAAVKFPMHMWKDTYYYWAKSGAMFLYIDLVNQTNGPSIYSVSSHAEYAHFSLITSASVGFPASISISFTGSYSISDSKNLYQVAY